MTQKLLDSHTNGITHGVVVPPSKRGLFAHFGTARRLKTNNHQTYPDLVVQV